MNRGEDRIGLGRLFLGGVVAFAILSASCATARDRVVLTDERIFIVEDGSLVDARGETVALGGVDGWYLISPGTMVRLIEAN